MTVRLAITGAGTGMSHVRNRIVEPLFYHQGTKRNRARPLVGHRNPFQTSAPSAKPEASTLT
jgi:hypothetical protein